MGATGELLGLGALRLKEMMAKRRVLLFCSLALAACAGDLQSLFTMLTPSGQRSEDEHRNLLCCFQPKPKTHLRGLIRTGTTHCNAGSVALCIKSNTLSDLKKGILE